MPEETTPAAGDDGTTKDAVADVTTEAIEIDLDGDGKPDAVGVRTTTVVDVDGDGVADVVDVVEAIGVDANQDGRLTPDEMTMTETVYVRDDLLDGDADS